VSRNPPPRCSVGHVGGSPVNCHFHIEGPSNTPYEGSSVVVEMIFEDGYPFRQPAIQILGRVLGLNFLPQLSGNTRMMHIKEVWTAEW
jgi:ubiquitin-protein ligase